MIKPEDLVGLKVRAQLGIREHEGREYNHIDYFCEPVPRPLGDILLDNWFVWAEENLCPADEPGAPCINDWIFEAARQCKWFKLPPSWAVLLIRKELTRAEKPNEVPHAVENAYDTSVPCTATIGQG